MLMPSKVKYRKQQRGRMRGKAFRGGTLAFGDMGLQILEPGWITDLEPAERGRARRLIARLRDDGVADAEGLVRRDIVGGVPALAAAAIGKRLAELSADATPNDIAELLAEGRDERLGVRWRLVDGDGRPILLETAARRRR